jgi:putative FmdB family regulatory protein
MPVYGYRCSRGHHFEVQQRITEPALSQCPECGAPVTRVFYPVGIVFKGSGFYKTDSRGASSDGSTATTETAKPETKTKSETKTTASKPAKSEEKTSPKEGAA